ncbi:GNAT family N-acetyltransferase [Aggregatimonas sangjinii]|uniref:GNAT family N-acetyltransferase n=1 Tax=Aggregatimonas sangjinii TaxID=2583587 RepID=A0A5B7SKM0_9FLAO|nr:GNAT family N-acetyltransferase [Aggregatimonas sangjinii]QCW98581.1 GNAT family N-acetyltransferase [Aggregatimonas sangjinii]
MMRSTINIRLANENDLLAIETVGEALFDYPILKNRTVEFLNDPRHHLALAFEHDTIVGMASGVHYVHPDKDPSLFINEVSVLEGYQNHGIGRSLVKYLCAHASHIGCSEAWVLTGQENGAAQKAYLAAGGKKEDANTILFEFEL